MKTLMRDEPVIANRDPHPRRNVHDDKMYPIKQRIADRVAIEGNTDNCGGSEATEEETGAVRKS